MKDSRFIELLNLYIDRQITAAETAELESEIQQNPDRQAIYRQYCRIHSATKLVYDSFRANAAERSTPQPEHAEVVELFEAKRRWRSYTYFAGGLAAACLALVFIRHNPAAPVGGELAVTAVRPAAIQPAMVQAEIATAAVKEAELPNGPVNLRNNLIAPDYSALLAALREQDEERAVANGHFQIPPARSLFDDGVFNSSRTAPAHDSRPFRIQQTPAQQAEFTAFQFQR